MKVTDFAKDLFLYFLKKKTDKNPSRLVGRDHLGDGDFHQRPPTFDNPDTFTTSKFQLKLVLKLMFFSQQVPENIYPKLLEVQTMEIFFWCGSPLQKHKTTCSFSNLISTKHSSVWWYEVNLQHISCSLLKSWTYDNYFFCHWHRNVLFVLVHEKSEPQLFKFKLSSFKCNLASCSLACLNLICKFFTSSN